MTVLHITFVFFSVGVILLADKEGFAWIRGKKETLNPKRLHLLHVLTWTGLLALIASGAILFLPRAKFLLTEPLFIIKMLFVAVLVVNAFLIGRLMHVATVRSFRTLAFSEKIQLFVSGAISTVSWAGVIVLALYLFGFNF
ncbi:MAG: hypothetical protein V4437_02660 [Patescibacteria group bacterium]